ncbi:hypothetical protein D3C85_1444940 [compost metagenome]
MEDIVNADHGLRNAAVISHIADIELDLVIGQGDAHIFLLLFIPAEHPNFLDIRIEETLQHRITERTSTTGNHQDLVIKHKQSPHSKI